MFKQEGDYEKLCIALNYQFRNKMLLAKALTTKSAWSNSLQQKLVGHHEEPAFFGDGILRMVVNVIGRMLKKIRAKRGSMIQNKRYKKI